MSEENEQLQEKVDKLKTLSLLNNLHNLNPPAKQNNNMSEILVVEALKVTPRLQDIYLEVRGLARGEDDKLIKISRPIMNMHGAFKLVKIIQHIAEEVEYANYDEDVIPGRIVLYYEMNYPYFTLWCKDYELDPMDFNYISTTLLSFIDSAFHKAKNGHFSRIVTKTYAEKTLDKAIEGNKKEEKRGGFLSRLAGR